MNCGVGGVAIIIIMLQYFCRSGNLKTFGAPDQPHSQELSTWNLIRNMFWLKYIYATLRKYWRKNENHCTYENYYASVLCKNSSTLGDLHFVLQTLSVIFKKFLPRKFCRKFFLFSSIISTSFSCATQPVKHWRCAFLCTNIHSMLIKMQRYQNQHSCARIPTLFSWPYLYL